MFGFDDWMAAQGLGQLGGGLFNKFFNKSKNPYDAASSSLDEIPGIGGKYYDPYIDYGKGMMGAGDIYQQMFSDPAAFFNKLASGYQQSPGYQNTLKEALGAISNQAAAGGMAGSPMAGTAAGEKAADIANKDFQQYINNILGIESGGLSGAEAGMNRGFNASSSLADILSNAKMNKANLKMKSADWKNQNSNNNWSNIFSGAANLMPWMFNK